MESKKQTKNKKEVAITEEEMIIYAGDNGRTFLNKFKAIEDKKLTFNFAAAFFGVFYFIYRKMYISALFAALLGILSDSFILAIITAIFMGLVADYVYYLKMKKDIEAIKEGKYTASVKKELIRQSGGTCAILPVILLSAIAVVTVVFITVMALFPIIML